MRAVLLASLLLSLSALPARGQNAPSLLYVTSAIPWEPDQPQRITWSLPATAPVPTALVAAVDGGAWLPAPADCDPTLAGDRRWCHTINPAIKALLDVPGTHRVVLAIGLDASAALWLQTRPPAPTTCSYQAPGATTLEARPRGAALQGFLPWNKVAGDTYAAARLAQLRAWGWRVEWQAATVALVDGVRLVAVCQP